MIEIGMGSVQTGECDVMGHMNVRHYISPALEALAWLGLGLGLGPAHALEHSAGLAPADQHIRFLREMPAGAPFAVWGGVILASAWPRPTWRRTSAPSRGPAPSPSPAPWPRRRRRTGRA